MLQETWLRESPSKGFAVISKCSNPPVFSGRASGGLFILASVLTEKQLIRLETTCNWFLAYAILLTIALSTNGLVICLNVYISPNCNCFETELAKLNQDLPLIDVSFR